MNTQAKKDALEFLMSQKNGVISTVTNEQPQSAYIYYMADENLNIYFITMIHSRKYNNIQLNNRVSFTVGSEKPPRTVQIDGTVEVVTDENTINKVTANYYSSMKENNLYPVPLTKLATTNGLTVYKIQPHWLRWSDFTDMKKKDDYGVSIVLIDSNQSLNNK